MYSAKQRKAAIDTFIRFDHSYADTIAELGYPSRAQHFACGGKSTRRQISCLSRRVVSEKLV